MNENDTSVLNAARMFSPIPSITLVRPFYMHDLSAPSCFTCTGGHIGFIDNAALSHCRHLRFIPCSFAVKGCLQQLHGMHDLYPLLAVQVSAYRKIAAGTTGGHYLCIGTVYVVYLSFRNLK